MTKFEGKTVLITGGGTGVGRATSELLASRGAKIVVNYAHSEKDARETVETIQKAGGEAIALKANVALEQEVLKMVADAKDAFGEIHYLVNNAGMTYKIPLSDLDAVTDEIWDEIFSINLKGMFYCSRAVAPGMKKLKDCAIVNLGSTAGIGGIGSSLPYAVSKSAVHGLTRSLARALAPEIRVNCIAPGPIMTRWWKGDEERMYSISDGLLLGRVSTPEDLAELIATMLTQESLTGQIISPNNGMII